MASLLGPVALAAAAGEDDEEVFALLTPEGGTGMGRPYVSFLCSEAVTLSPGGEGPPPAPSPPPLTAVEGRSTEASSFTSEQSTAGGEEAGTLETRLVISLPAGRGGAEGGVVVAMEDMGEVEVDTGERWRRKRRRRRFRREGARIKSRLGVGLKRGIGNEVWEWAWYNEDCNC